jgi:secreted trypsin-like serine protease
MQNNLQKSLKKILVLLWLSQSFIAQAIVMRHDVDTSEYLLDTLEYQSTIHVDGCTATLIAPRWILTAAHCIGNHYPTGLLLKLADQNIAVKSTYMHPEFTQEGTPHHDIALIELAEPSFSIIPTPPYEKNDEQGEVMKLVGYGGTGNGQTGVTNRCNPCELHGADNIVKEANIYHLRFHFDAPSSNDSLALEGVGGPGDSGGPVFIEVAGERFVAGVSSFGGNFYNDFDQYTRVSMTVNWLAETMANDYSGSYSGPLYSETVKIEDNKGGGTTNLIWLLGINILLLFRCSKTYFETKRQTPNK